MNRLRTITVLCMLVTTLVLLAGCTTYDNFKQAFIDDPDTQSETIDIGVYEPMSGADKDAAAPELSGIELAHSVMPEVDGREVRLIYADNSSDIDAAETAINTLISKQPSIILGSYGSIYSLVAGEYVMDAAIPAIAATNTNPLVTRNNPYYFRVCYVDATQGRLLAQYLNANKVKEAGVLLPEGDDAATATSTAFMDEMRTLSDNDDAIAFYDKYTTGDIDFTEHLQKLKRSGVKYVLLPGEVIDAANIIRQAEDMGLNITFLGTTVWGSTEFLAALNGKLETTPAGTTITADPAELTSPIDSTHLAFVQFYTSEGADDPAVISKAREAFLEAYHKQYGNDQEPEEAVALGYDSYCMAVDAILQAEKAAGGAADGPAILQVLTSETYEFDGASGIIRFNKRHNPKQTAYISTWNTNTILAIHTIDADDQ